MTKTQEKPARILVIPGPAIRTVPEGANYRAREAHRAEIAARHPRSRKLLAIMSTLANGALPWGVKWDTFMTRHRDEWILCCGHVLGFTEAQKLVSAGLLTTSASGPIGSLTITPAGREWLVQNWAPSREPKATRALAPDEPREPWEEGRAR